MLRFMTTIVHEKFKVIIKRKGQIKILGLDHGNSSLLKFRCH